MFTVLIYDYDAAPDAECYYIYKRIKASTLEEAKRDARYYFEEKDFLGAKVIDADKKEVFSLGVTLTS